MRESRVAYRYALAFLEVAEEQKKLDDVGKDCEFIRMLTKGSREFVMFLRSPVITTVRKEQALSEIFTGRVSDLTMKFIQLLASKDRESILPEVIHQFIKLRDERLGILNVTARSAAKFTDAQHQQLVRQLEEATKKKVNITYTLDPSLKGGFLVQHGDTVWDASVRHQLDVLKKRFVEGTA
jgi:F-type H+-transporting ATPase subunit delta